MAALTSAITLAQEIVHRIPATPGARVFQMVKAFMALAAIIVIPTIMVAWARKNYRP
ncbi:MAG TPA: hypothetical protein VJS39_03815 [Gemmatimonadaceae bacterium]|nr:hypothetical protein [Gemmatimonadaceae bacterium]